MSNLGRNKQITDELLNKFEYLCLNGMTRAEAAAKVGFSLAGIRVALKRAKRALPRNRLIDKVEARKQEIQDSGKSQKFWAGEFGVSQPAIFKVFAKLRISKYGRNRNLPGPSIDHQKRIKEYRQILEHIQKHGGYVPHAIKALGLKTPPQPVREFARAIGFNLSHYQFAWKQYGLWLTLPGPWKKLPPTNYSVPAICQGCSTTVNLNLCNAKSGKTKGCKFCSCKAKEFFKVENKTTGEIHPSIMSWAREVGVYPQYQKYRLLLQQNESVIINDNIYKIIE
ncbi:hypothetical protein [Synechococcus sp. WH 8016]|uniref:hypothetical protein n=1 Tax=Synechococcus sp. WH 8016 TaxID=166318 RepID=UPI00022DA14B|nr:hypothetical protein [Synechococcus sp. WH 8016]EHA63723.1 hypothetical protein Syn8016DRAFT_0764 [Synechococcus sp. WH 8016]